MIEAKFKVDFISDNVFVTAINKEATNIENEFNEKFPNNQIFKYILQSPNTLVSHHPSFIYEVDTSFKDEVFNELRE